MKKDTEFYGPWHDIEGYPGYQVSKQGYIRSLKKRSGPALLSQRIDKRVHAVTVQVLTAEGRRTSIRVGRAVIETFVGKTPKGMCICHKNGNLLDNRLSNLVWMTRQEEARKFSGAIRKPVAKIDFNGKVIESYRSAKEAAEKNGVNYHYVNCRCRGRIVRDTMDNKGCTYMYLDNLFDLKGDSMEW